MAIFLLIYVIFLIIWFIWTGILVYHALKFQLPHDKESKVFLIGFTGVSALILIISFIAISQADWLTIPEVFGGR